MALRLATSKLKSLMLPRLEVSRRRTYATSSSSTVHSAHSQSPKLWDVRPDYVPIYMVLGMVMTAASIGIYTATHQIMRSPSVRVSKTKRETLPEVEDPDMVVSSAEKFVNKSLLRKLAHLKDHEHRDLPRYVETLKNVGVDPTPSLP